SLPPRGAGPDLWIGLQLLLGADAPAAIRAQACAGDGDDCVRDTDMELTFELYKWISPISAWATPLYTTSGNSTPSEPFFALDPTLFRASENGSYLVLLSAASPTRIVLELSCVGSPKGGACAPTCRATPTCASLDPEGKAYCETGARRCRYYP